MTRKKSKISMQLIADRLGVSKYTVSQALSGKPGVSEATRKEVAAMAKALGYRIKATSAASRTTTGPHPESKRHVAVWMQSAHRADNTFWSRVLDGIITGCRGYGLQEKFLNLPAGLEKQAAGITPQAANRRLASQHGAPEAGDVNYKELLDVTTGFTGVIVLGTLPATTLLKLQLPGIPMVLVDHEEPLLNADCILNDNRQAAGAACRQLLSKGCKSLLFLGRDSFSISFKERWWGCRQAVEEHSRTTDGCTLKKWTLPYGQHGWEQHLAGRIQSLEADQLPDGFVCANDQIALALIEALQKCSVRVPENCKVCGIDNIDESAASNPPLTTVELAKELLGYRAVEALVRQINLPGYHAEKIILSARLIQRASG